MNFLIGSKESAGNSQCCSYIHANYLKEQTNATSGNISVQLDKLNSAGYITVTKEFVGKRTRTSCRLTEEGKRAMKEYIDTLKSYLNL